MRCLAAILTDIDAGRWERPDPAQRRAAQDQALTDALAAVPATDRTVKGWRPDITMDEVLLTAARADQQASAALQGELGDIPGFAVDTVEDMLDDPEWRAQVICSYIGFLVRVNDLLRVTESPRLLRAAARRLSDGYTNLAAHARALREVLRREIAELLAELNQLDRWSVIEPRHDVDDLLPCSSPRAVAGVGPHAPPLCRWTRAV